jgi:RNA polymerase sigma-70 factor (ECF subfamily)
MGFNLLDPDRGLDKFAAGFIRQMARKLVGKFGFTESDRDDLEQELVAELVARFPKFNPSRGKRTTFTSSVLKNKVANLLRDRRALCRNRGRSPESLNAESRLSDGRTVETAQLIDDSARLAHTGRLPQNPEELARLRFDLQQVIPHLPEKLRDLCQLLLEGLSVTEAARTLGVSRATVVKRQRQILNRFRDHGLDGYL